MTRVRVEQRTSRCHQCVCYDQLFRGWIRSPFSLLIDRERNHPGGRLNGVLESMNKLSRCFLVTGAVCFSSVVSGNGGPFCQGG